MKRLLLILIALPVFATVNAQYKTGVIFEPVLKTDTTAIGQKIVYPVFPENEVTISKVIIPPGKATGWHRHLITVFAYVEEGTLTVQQEDGKETVYQKNSAIAESLNTYHNGINRGTADVVLIAIYLGEKGKPLSEPLSAAGKHPGECLLQ